MENFKVIMASHGKLTLRELNLGKGGNNVRWLNDREERLLQKSMNSMEKEHERTLNRLETEVKELHHTLREQVTIRSPRISKEACLLDKEGSEAKRPVTAINTVTFNLHAGETLAPSKTEEGTRGSVEEFKESTLEHIGLENVSSLSKKTSRRSLEKTNSQPEIAWTKKLSSVLKRPLSNQLSNSSEHSSSSTTALSVPRRKISVTDPPSAKELSRPRLRKTSSHSSLQVSANTTFNRGKTRSTEMINVASTHPNGSALNDPFSPSLRKVSTDSMNHMASPLFFRRKISPSHAARNSSSPRMVRKISCPPQIQHLPRVQQEEVIPHQLSRDNTGTTSRATATMATDLPKLDVSRGFIEQAPPFEGNVSPLGLHVDSIDYTLQEKVNNFLKSLEINDENNEHEVQTRADKQ